MYYRIAGHIIRVNTPDRAKTIEVLPNFEPFRIGEESGMSGEVLNLRAIPNFVCRRRKRMTVLFGTEFITRCIKTRTSGRFQ